MFESVTVTTAGKPPVTRTKTALEADMRRVFNDTYVDLFLLELDTQGTARFRLNGVDLDVNVKEPA